MPSEDTKILEFNQYQKYDKGPFIIYADLNCLIEKSSTAKVGEHIPSGFSMFTLCSNKNFQMTIF